MRPMAGDFEWRHNTFVWDKRPKTATSNADEDILELDFRAKSLLHLDGLFWAIVRLSILGDS